MKSKAKLWGATLVAVAVLVAACLLINLMPRGAMRADSTNEALATPSAEGVEYVKALSSDVTVYHLAAEGAENLWLETLLDKYALLSGHLTVERVTDAASVAAIAPYISGVSEIEDNSLVIVSGGRGALLLASAMYEYEYAYSYAYSGYAVSSATYVADGALINAIGYVTRDDLPKLYAVSGHGEKALSSAFKTMLLADNVIGETATIEAGVPEDAACLLISAPASDYTEAEIAALRAYLTSGGRLMIETGYDTPALPALEALLSEYGMERDMGIVLDTASGYYYYANSTAYNYYLTPPAAEHAANPELGAVMLPLSHALIADEGAEALFTTSDSSYLKHATQITTTDKEEGDADGPFPVVLAAEKGEARLIWSASASFTEVHTNSALIKGVLSWLTPLPEDAAQIAGKNVTGAYIALTEGNVFYVLAGYVGYPLLILAALLIIAKRRKSKKA